MCEVQRLGEGGGEHEGGRLKKFRGDRLSRSRDFAPQTCASFSHRYTARRSARRTGRMWQRGRRTTCVRCESVSWVMSACVRVGRGSGGARKSFSEPHVTSRLSRVRTHVLSTTWCFSIVESAPKRARTSHTIGARGFDVCARARDHLTTHTASSKRLLSPLR